jgi:ribosome-associated protein
MKLQDFRLPVGRGENQGRPMHDHDPLGKSKSAYKREALELQELGQTLLRCSTRELAKLDLPPDLLEALDQAKRISSREALRRQMQFIGTIMRRIDEDVLAAARHLVHAREVESQATAQEFQKTESLRERLIEDDPGTMEEILALCPDADREFLDSLTREARRELAKGRPPKAYRKLFRYLRSCLTPEPDRGSSSPTRSED